MDDTIATVAIHIEQLDDGQFLVQTDSVDRVSGKPDSITVCYETIEEVLAHVGGIGFPE